MKKFISILCTLAMVCGFSSVVAFAEGTSAEDTSSLSLSTSYMASDWETTKDEVTENGDIVLVTVKAEDIAGMEDIATKCDKFAAIDFEISYNKEAVTPYTNTPYEVTIFAAKYTNPKKNVPTASTEGVISEGNIIPVSNLDDPEFVSGGKATMSIVDFNTKGFCLNGDFVTFYFEVIDSTKNCDLGLTLNTIKILSDNSVYTPSSVTGTTVLGMGGGSASNEPVVTMDETPATKYEYGEVYNQGVGGTVTVPEGKSTTGLTITLNNGEKDGTVDFDFGTNIAANTTFGLNICRIPKDTTITFVKAEAK